MSEYPDFVLTNCLVVMYCFCSRFDFDDMICYIIKTLINLYMCDQALVTVIILQIRRNMLLATLHL